MLKTISLILPVLIPSWRFFKAVEPSPRVQWTMFDPEETSEPAWQEYQPRPKSVSVLQMIRRLFWNPAWNDALFVVSCAERIALGEMAHSITEIQRRIIRDISRLQPDLYGEMLQFRLVFVHHDNTGFVQDVVFLSDPFAVGPSS